MARDIHVRWYNSYLKITNWGYYPCVATDPFAVRKSVTIVHFVFTTTPGSNYVEANKKNSDVYSCLKQMR